MRARDPHYVFARLASSLAVVCSAE
jgi:hypothetical protein